MSLEHSHDDLTSGHLAAANTGAAGLETKIATACQVMESAVGYRLEIDRFEPLQVDGQWKLRVFWRKALGSSCLSQEPSSETLRYWSLYEPFPKGGLARTQGVLSTMYGTEHS